MEQYCINEQHGENNQNHEMETIERQDTPTHQFTILNDIPTSLYYGVAQTVQVPEYTVEQKMMQESIRADEHGLLKIRESMKIQCTSLLIVFGMMLITMVVALVQLTILGFVSGGSVRFLSTTELVTIRIFYMIFIGIGSISFVNQIMLLRKVNKIRTVSIPTLETIANGSILSGTIFTSAVLFFSAFWLMTSQTSYWMYFIFQGSVIFVTYLLIYLLIRKVETILKRTKKYNIRRDNKPKAEIEYYKPIGYTTEVRYMNR